VLAKLLKKLAASFERNLKTSQCGLQHPGQANSYAWDRNAPYLATDLS
jgi:hypothetical protein